MKKIFLLTILLSIVAFASCNKMEYDFCFSQVGGPLECEMDIDAETLQIRSENDVSEAPRNLGDGQYYAELEGITVFYYTEEHSFYLIVDKNNTGKERRFSVSGTKNGKEVSFNFRQRK